MDALYNRATCHSIPVTCNSKLPVCYTKMAVAEQVILGILATTLPSFIMETAQYDMIHVHSSHRNEEKAAHQGKDFKYTVASYDVFQAVLGFLCRCVLCYVSLTFTLMLTRLSHIME